MISVTTAFAASLAEMDQPRSAYPLAKKATAVILQAREGADAMLAPTWSVKVHLKTQTTTMASDAVSLPVPARLETLEAPVDCQNTIGMLSVRLHKRSGQTALACSCRLEKDASICFHEMALIICCLKYILLNHCRSHCKYVYGHNHSEF